MFKQSKINSKLMMDQISRAYSDPAVVKRSDLRKLLLTYAQLLEKTGDASLVATKLCYAIHCSWLAQSKDFPKAILTLYQELRGYATQYASIAAACALLPLWL